MGRDCVASTRRLQHLRSALLSILCSNCTLPRACALARLTHRSVTQVSSLPSSPLPARTQPSTEALAQRVAEALRLQALQRWPAVLSQLKPLEDFNGAEPRLCLQAQLLHLRAQSTLHADAAAIETAQALITVAHQLGDAGLECEALSTAAQLLGRFHLFNEALAFYGQAEALAMRAGLKTALWPLLLGIGRLLYDAELHTERIAHCERVLREHPDAPPALRYNMLNMMAGAHKWLGDQWRAREIWLAMLDELEGTQEPILLLTLSSLANSCAWTGHIEQGWAYLKRREALSDPASWSDDGRLWHEQARALLIWKGGDAAGALPVFEQVVGLGRRHLQLRTGLIAGLTRQAEAAQEAGRLDVAVAAQQELLVLTQQRTQEQSRMYGDAMASMVRAARLEAEKASIERERETLELRVAERTAELSAALARVQAEVEMRRMTEAALQQAHAELELRVQQRTAELEQAMRLLSQREKLAALGHLVAGVAHELNTPIGNARLAANTLIAESESFRTRLQAQSLRRADLQQFTHSVDEGAQLVDRSLDRASRLIQRFKTVARPESTGRHVVELDLSDFLAETLDLVRANLDDRAQWLLERPPRLPARLDADALTQVLTQLLDNAWVHGIGERSSGRIELVLNQESDGWARIVIRDDGPGIPPEHLERVFEPFFTTRLGQGGSGLGLHHAFTLTSEVLRGELRVHNLEPAGACFTLRLPLQ